MTHKISFKFNGTKYETVRESGKKFVFGQYEFSDIFEWIKFIKTGEVPLKIESKKYKWKTFPFLTTSIFWEEEEEGYEYELSPEILNDLLNEN